MLIKRERTDVDTFYPLDEVRSARAVPRTIDRKVFVKMLSCPGRITWLSPFVSYWRLHLSEHH
jgi:hypothetical protein